MKTRVYKRDAVGETAELTPGHPGINALEDVSDAVPHDENGCCDRDDIAEYAAGEGLAPGTLLIMVEDGGYGCWHFTVAPDSDDGPGGTYGDGLLP